MTQMCNSEVKVQILRRYTIHSVLCLLNHLTIFIFTYVLTPPLHIYIIPNPYLFFYAEYLHEAGIMSKYIAVCFMSVHYCN